MASEIKLVRNAELAKAIILSPEFTTYSMADRYRDLMRRTNVDFNAAITLLDHLPVFIDGDNHQRIRKLMAKQISRTKSDQLIAATKSLSHLVGKTFVAAREIELIAEFCQPLWRAISTTIVSQNEATLQLVDAVPGLFSPLLSIRERVKINDLIADFLAEHPAETDDELILVCLAALGARPFVGSLGLSLLEIFQRNKGIKLNEISWPKIFPSSSLTYVDRVFAGPEQSSASFETGDRVRCLTQYGGYTAEENRSALFGFGAHTCLGKSISEKVWSEVVKELSRIKLRADCRSIMMSPHNDPFQMPGEIRITMG